MFKKKRRWHCLSGQEPTDLDKKVMYWENKGKLVPTRDLIKVYARAVSSTPACWTRSARGFMQE